jgi:hemoglobin-like flavoprotein
LSKRDMIKRDTSRRGNMGRQSSARMTPLPRQDSHPRGFSGGISVDSSSQALLIGDDSEDMSSSENSVSNATGKRGPTSAALPESISWRVTNSWKLVEDKREKVGVEFFLSLFEEHPQAADLFHFGNQVMYTSGKIDRRSQDVPKSLKVHARKVMDAVGLCVQGIEHLPDLVPTLRTLGTLHASLGVQDFHYDVVYKHLMRAIEDEVGSDVFDKDTRIAWEIAFRSLTNVMKHPEAVLQIEPLEGWGVVNTVACAFLVIFTPLQMAGITRNNYYFNGLLSFLTFCAGLVLVFDMSSHWIAKKVRAQGSSNHATRGPLRRKFDMMIFPVQFRVVRFLRGLQMDRWTKWHGMEFIILASFALQNSGYFFAKALPAGSTAVHWTYLFGLLRLVAGSRVVHSLTCAENNLLLRRRQISSQELLSMRMVKLIFTMLIVIHVNACLWCVVARVGFGFDGLVDPVPTSFFPKHEIFLGTVNPLNSYLHAVQ